MARRKPTNAPRVVLSLGSVSGVPQWLAKSTTHGFTTIGDTPEEAVDGARVLIGPRVLFLVVVDG